MTLDIEELISFWLFHYKYGAGAVNYILKSLALFCIHCYTEK